MCVSQQGWIGVDLDGVLARYDGWVDYSHIGEPIMPMVNRVKKWLAEGKIVKIFTARIAHDSGVYNSYTYKPIEDWCLKHIGQILPITNIKDFAMVELWDDRCRQVEPNTGHPVDSEWTSEEYGLHEAELAKNQPCDCGDSVESDH